MEHKTSILPRQIVSESEVCEALNLSHSTVRRLVASGKLRRSAVSTGRSLFHIGEVQRFAATPRVERSGGSDEA